MGERNVPSSTTKPQKVKNTKTSHSLVAMQPADTEGRNRLKKVQHLFLTPPIC